MMPDEVSAIPHGVAKFGNADEGIVSNVASADSDEVKLGFVRRHEALLTREDRLGGVCAGVEAYVD